MGVGVAGAFAVLLGLYNIGWSQGPMFLKSRLEKAILLNYNNNHGPTTQATIEAIVQLGLDKGFSVDVVNNGAKFNDTDLQNYQVAIFIQNRSFGLNDDQKAAFERWYKQGKGVFCTHAATVSQGWDYYHNILGTVLAPHSDVIETEVTPQYPAHPIMKGLSPETLSWTDEWFYWNGDPREKDSVEVLLTVDFSRPEFDDNLHEYPVPVHDVYPNAWLKYTDGGRFLTWGATHTTEALEKYPEFFNGFIFNGLKYIAGRDTVEICENLSMCDTLETATSIENSPPQNAAIFPGSWVSGIESIQILDVSGKKKGNINGITDVAFTDQREHPGLYILKIRRHGRVFTKRFFHINGTSPSIVRMIEDLTGGNQP